MSVTLTFVYNANGGSGAAGTSGTTFYPSSFPYTGSKTISGGSPTREYYDFLGWSRSSSATSPSYYNGNSFSQTFTYGGQTVIVTFYAVWKRQTVTLSYNPNGGVGAPSAQTLFRGGRYDISTTAPTRSGYNFLGWATSSSATTAQYQPGGSISMYANTTLYAVWEVNSSTISASDGTLGSPLTISISRNSNSYTDTITYQYGEETGTIVTKTSDPTVLWAAPISLASQFPSAASGVCTLTCTTFNGNTKLGSSSITILLSIPSSVKLKVDSVAIDETVSSIATQFGEFVQTKSKVSVTATTDSTDAYGATAASYSININGQTLTQNGATTDALVSSGTNNYSVTLTDSRGRTDTYVGTFNVTAYSSPSISASAERDDSTHTNINVAYQFAISSLSSQNTKTLKIYYKPHTSSSYSLKTTITPNEYSGNGTYTITSTTATVPYDVKINVIDYFETVSYVVQVAAYGSRIVHVSSADNTIVIHGLNSHDGEDHWEDKILNFGAGIKVQGKTLLNLTYPVGSIYMSVNSTSPATLFGGTWQQISDTFLLAAGSTYTAGSTGGEATHTLTENEIPSHTHVEQVVTNAGVRPWASVSASSGTGKYVNLQEKLTVGSNDNENQYVRTGSTGGGDAHNNMPPYLAVYVWKRTA